MATLARLGGFGLVPSNDTGFRSPSQPYGLHRCKFFFLENTAQARGTGAWMQGKNRSVQCAMGCYNGTRGGRKDVEEEGQEGKKKQ